MISVLVVDDNLSSLKQIGAQLAEHYEVLLAKSGEIALEICGKEKPDLVLLDVEMPGMDGFETIARLRQDPVHSRIPVIFLTGNHDAATEIRCLESGAMDFISKPADTEILRHRIELHLQFSAYQLHLEKQVKELEDTIGISFAELVECKDFNIAGHVLRTAEYAEMLAGELLKTGAYRGEIDEAFTVMLKRAAPFHDIGKIGISDMILLKRSSLTEHEYSEIKKHTIIGSNMLETIFRRTPSQKHLALAAEIARGHHERWDGRGYPDGLSGEKIPLSCRIVALANVYDACMTDRVYRKGYSREETCRMIEEDRGRKFDPVIVDAFVRIKNEFVLLGAKTQIQDKDRTWSFYHEANLGG